MRPDTIRARRRLASTMLTMDVCEDVALYHHRQIIPLTRDQWADWLDPAVPAEAVLRHLPSGSLPATCIFPPAPPQAQLQLRD